MAFQSKSLTGYNSISGSQLCVAQKYIPEIIENLKHAESLCTGPIRIVDYGCSEGRNSLLTFSEAFAEYRKISNRAVEILHTDLPDNSWSTVYHTINDSEESYLKLPNIFYSTLGRSFFSQVVPSSSVHFGYSSYAMHYLSQKQKRNEGEYGWVFPAAKAQGFEDMRHLLGVRLEELVNGGVLQMIVGGREGVDDPEFAKINFGSVKKLLDRGVITSEEFKNYVWHSHPYNVEEMLEVLHGFGDRLEVIKCEFGKENMPEFANFLQSNDVEKFRNDIRMVSKVMMKNTFMGCLERSEEEKLRIFEIAVEESVNVIAELNHTACFEYLVVIIRKLR